MKAEKEEKEPKEKKKNDGLKDYENNIIPASAILDRKKQVYSIGPAIDLGLNGGVPEGNIIVICGEEKCGKTTTALELCSNIMAKDKSRKLIYGDVEVRIEDKNLLGVHGLDVSRMELIRSSENDIMTAEKHFDAYEKRLAANPGCILVIDSVSALISDVEMTNDFDDQVRDSTGKIQSKFFRRLINYIRPNNSIVICMTHLISNPGYGGSVMEKTSKALSYYQDIKLVCKGTPKKWYEGEEGSKQIGQIITWKVKNSALGGPGAEVESYLRFGYGIDHIMEYARVATDLGLIEKSGSWFIIQFGPDKGKKMQGANNVLAYLKDNPKVLAELEKSIKEML